MWERHEIETFLMLAGDLHFGRTAARLRLTTSRVSQTIKKLERRIGAPLFERTSRQVRLTPLGRQLADGLGPIVAELANAIRDAAEAARGITGTLGVGYSTPWAGELLTRAAGAFHARHPDCAVYVQEVQPGDPFGGLRAGDLDVQIGHFPVDEADITRGPVVFSEPRALVVPRTHPLAERASVSLEDLAEVPLVTLAGATPGYSLDYHYPRRTPGGKPIPRGPGAVYWNQVLSYVATGRGVTFAAARAVHHHGRSDIVFVPFTDAPAIDYGLLWPTARETARTRAFVKTVLDVRWGYLTGFAGRL
ncbi:LysR family transcriptional regulator [Actinorhabdospora filicis]|uniref:LysR family transcriptional regulator n=1 Tax=Actinorhabdospora filicis TaxID=1785913 RepID=A0A9W6W8Z8_9ACTN|nr:LysR family transcriptional regulator [Actinorhabdospora filicis]GLZ77498.1 LysR family transcriptional regulator [Actinorhabdospora filicis]